MLLDDKARKRQKQLKNKMIICACIFAIVYYLLNTFLENLWGNSRIIFGITKVRKMEGQESLG